ncbi:MAG: tetratricopeptide repeat protein [Pyrinomonadaceae bacterium]
MKAVRVLFFCLLLASCCLHVRAFQARTATPVKVATDSIAPEDELARHRSAAETYQLSGDLEKARLENQRVVSIGLRRLSNIAASEGDVKRASKILVESIDVYDSVEARTSLAIAQMQLGELTEGTIQARYAVDLAPKDPAALDALSKLLYLQTDYTGALPILERLFGAKQDFDSAYTLGMTYLRLKQPDRAKLLFEEILNAVNKKAALHVILGKAFEETNYPLEAEREFRNAIRADPKMPGARFYLGFTILEHGGSERLEEAGREFDLEIQLSPRDGYTHFLAGVVASSNADHPKAIRLLHTAIRLKPALGPAYLFLGQSQIEMGDEIGGEKSLRKSIELSDDSSKNSYQIRRAYFLLGRLMLKLGRKDEAEKNLAVARKLQGQLLESTRDDIRKLFGDVVGAAKAEEDPVEPTVKANRTVPELKPAEAAALKRSAVQLSAIVAQAYHNMGVIETQTGHVQDSVAKFSAASRWKADFPGLDRNWGIVLFRSDQFDKAIGPLSRHLKTKADDKLARRMLGVSYYFGKNFKAAVETLKPVEADLADDPELAYFFGIALVQIDRHPEAAIVFRRIADANPKSAQALHYAGQGLALAGELEKALASFRIAAAADPSMPGIHYGAGQVLIRLNRLEDAEKEFREELRLDPYSSFAKYHLAYSMLERKVGTDEAVTLLREAISFKYDYADARYQLGKALIEIGAIGESLEQLQTAALLEPRKDYIFYQLSIALRKASRIEEADKALKRYSELKAENRSETSGMGEKKNGP